MDQDSLDRIQRVQNNAIWYIFEIIKFEHVSDKLIDLSWLSMELCFNYHALCTFHKWQSIMLTSDVEICSQVLNIEPQPFRGNSNRTSINCTPCIPYKLKQHLISSSGIKSENICSVPSDSFLFFVFYSLEIISLFIVIILSYIAQNLCVFSLFIS